LLLHFVEHCCWDKALPKLKDPDRLPDPSTVRRWSSGLESIQLPLSFIRQTVTRIVHWRDRGCQTVDEADVLPWITSALQNLWPLRL
jgi:hypothetical protein